MDKLRALLLEFTRYDNNGRLKSDEDALCVINEFLSWYRPERLNPETVGQGFFPPPWNPHDHPEKTVGWCEFQRAMRKDPKYYLDGCDSLISTNK